MKRVAIIGDEHPASVASALAYIASLPADAEIVTNGATGVGTATLRAAKARGLSLRLILPAYVEHGKPRSWSDEQRRDIEIAVAADEVMAFHESADTSREHIMAHAIRLKRRVTVVMPEQAEVQS